MNVLRSVGRANFVLFITMLCILLIGFADYVTNPQFSFSLFYIIIIAILSAIDGIKLSHILVAAITSSVLWFYADYTSQEYSNILFSFWNAFVRLSIFIIIGVLFLRNKEKVELLKIANDKQKLLNEEKNKFIGIAAHDLRAPLGNIYAFSDLLLTSHKPQMDEDMIEVAEFIKNISKNGLELVNNLLDISKIESGKLELAFNAQDYVAFIKERLYLNQLLATKKNISIQFESENETIIANFDENYLSEVVDNLVSNAIKYSPKNSEIIVRIIPTAKNSILTEVIDHGNGIVKEEQDKLFTYFQKTSTRPTAGESSTGLGLAIAKRIIVGHNGEIGVKSVVNEGSNFYYTIPINQ